MNSVLKIPLKNPEFYEIVKIRRNSFYRITIVNANKLSNSHNARPIVDYAEAIAEWEQRAVEDSRF